MCVQFVVREAAVLFLHKDTSQKHTNEDVSQYCSNTEILAYLTPHGNTKTLFNSIKLHLSAAKNALLSK